MKISELSERSGIPVATLKFYIREGMLPRGEATSATSAEYDETHLDRLRLIGALAGVRGLPLVRVRDILDLIDSPLDSPSETAHLAVNALPPYAEIPAPLDGDDDDRRARAAIALAELTYDPSYAAVRQLDTAIRAVEDAGLPWDEPTLRRYSDAVRELATLEVVPIAALTRAEATTYGILGTALYEPVILALRRLALHHLLLTGQVPTPSDADTAEAEPA